MSSNMSFLRTFPFNIYFSDLFTLVKDARICDMQMIQLSMLVIAIFKLSIKHKSVTPIQLQNGFRTTVTS